MKKIFDWIFAQLGKIGKDKYTPNALKTLEQVPDILRRLSILEDNN